MRRVLEMLIRCVEEAHDTHIYDSSDPHPNDCVYCEAIRVGKEALDRSGE